MRKPYFTRERSSVVQSFVIRISANDFVTLCHAMIFHNKQKQNKKCLPIRCYNNITRLYNVYSTQNIIIYSRLF